MIHKYFIAGAIALALSIKACKNNTDTSQQKEVATSNEIGGPIMKYGFDLNEYEIVADTVKNGDRKSVV